MKIQLHCADRYKYARTLRFRPNGRPMTIPFRHESQPETNAEAREYTRAQPTSQALPQAV